MICKSCKGYFAPKSERETKYKICEKCFENADGLIARNYREEMERCEQELCRQEEGTKNRIGFYIRTEPYGWMSNFHRAIQCIDALTYQTNEHYYQSEKATIHRVKMWIRNAPKAYHAMMAGRALRPNEADPNWEINKIQVMLTGLRVKFNQNPELGQKLLDTGDAELYEDSPTDMFWGGALPGSQNMLGKLLMQVRKELREVPRPDAPAECTCEEARKAWKQADEDAREGDFRGDSQWAMKAYQTEIDYKKEKDRCPVHGKSVPATQDSDTFCLGCRYALTKCPHNHRPIGAHSLGDTCYEEEAPAPKDVK